MSKQVILVTGGAGFIGSHICKELARNGFMPVTVDNFSHGHTWAVQWGPLEKGDIDDRNFLDSVLTKYRPVGVVHCAALLDVRESVEHPGTYYRNNVCGSLTLLEALVAHGVHSIIFSSSCAIYGEVDILPVTEKASQSPLSPYGRTKLMMEQIIADFHVAHGIQYAFLRYFNAAGADPDCQIGESHKPHTHLIPIALEVASGQRPYLSIFGDSYPTRDGTCIRDYVHVTDLAEAHVKALKRLLQGGASMALNLGSGKGYSVRDVIQQTEKISGKKIPVKVSPPRIGDPPALYADVSQARRVLDWEPRYSDLDTIISTGWVWHQKSKHS